MAFLIGFFWLLFAIIGVQSFKSSFKRTCVWFEDIGNARYNNSVTTYAQNSAPRNIQFCGGYLDAESGAPMPWLKADLNTTGAANHKGYLCPRHSFCVEGNNPYNGTISFDNIPQSLELVFVIMSSNTFSDLMYYTTDTDYLIGAVCKYMSTWLWSGFNVS